jgi:molecular chaperone HtpG
LNNVLETVQLKVEKHRRLRVANFTIEDLRASLSSELEAIFLRNSSLSGTVLTTADKFKAWFEQSGTPFFKEYTDHRFSHSIDVFATSCEIIAENARDVLSSEDLNILFWACIIHDAGLHLTEDMFLLLIDRKNKTILRPGFDSASWPDLWDAFIAEAKRFNDKKLRSLFGDTLPVSEPGRTALDITNRDRLLIGEFLRRHHPRIAHEIAIGGIRDATGAVLDLLSGLSPQYSDLIGTIARSHGLQLRSTFDYLRENYDIRDYRHIHIIFLMVLIRIADFLQIQSARAGSGSMQFCSRLPGRHSRSAAYRDTSRRRLSKVAWPQSKIRSIYFMKLEAPQMESFRT